MKPQKRPGWVLSFTLLGLIWGSSFLFIKEGLQILSPFGIAFWRTALGAVVMALIIVIRRHKLPGTLKQWALIWVGGLLMSGVPAALFGYAQQHVSSALASILNASTPIFTVIAIMIAFRDEKPKRYVVVGLLIGLLGVGIVLAVWSGFGVNDPLAIGALVLAVTCYGFGTPFTRKYISTMSIGSESAVFVQVSTSALTMLPLYLLTGPVFIGDLAPIPVISMLILGFIGTGFAYVAYYDIIHKVGSAIASSVTYITHLVGVLLGALLLNETITWNQPVGGLVILLGAAIAQGRFNGLVSKK
jgi:drug/metabolite transporter (DMT)-like permease